MIEVEWTDGSRMSAPDADALLDEVREVQWDTYTHMGLRRQLAKRARVWTDTRIRWWPWVTSDEFIHELERAGLLTIIRENHLSD